MPRKIYDSLRDAVDNVINEFKGPENNRNRSYSGNQENRDRDIVFITECFDNIGDIPPTLNQLYYALSYYFNKIGETGYNPLWHAVSEAFKDNISDAGLDVVFDTKIDESVQNSLGRIDLKDRFILGANENDDRFLYHVLAKFDVGDIEYEGHQKQVLIKNKNANKEIFEQYVVDTNFMERQDTVDREGVYDLRVEEFQNLYYRYGWVDFFKQELMKTEGIDSAAGNRLEALLDKTKLIQLEVKVYELVRILSAWTSKEKNTNIRDKFFDILDDLYSGTNNDFTDEAQSLRFIKEMFDVQQNTENDEIHMNELRVHILGETSQKELKSSPPTYEDALDSKSNIPIATIYDSLKHAIFHQEEGPYSKKDGDGAIARYIKLHSSYKKNIENRDLDIAFIKACFDNIGDVPPTLNQLYYALSYYCNKIQARGRSSMLWEYVREAFEKTIQNAELDIVFDSDIEYSIFKSKGKFKLNSNVDVDFKEKVILHHDIGDDRYLQHVLNSFEIMHGSFKGAHRQVLVKNEKVEVEPFNQNTYETQFRAKIDDSKEMKLIRREKFELLFKNTGWVDIFKENLIKPEDSQSDVGKRLEALLDKTKLINRDVNLYELVRIIEDWTIRERNDEITENFSYILKNLYSGSNNKLVTKAESIEFIKHMFISQHSRHNRPENVLNEHVTTVMSGHRPPGYSEAVEDAPLSASTSTSTAAATSSRKRRKDSRRGYNKDSSMEMMNGLLNLFTIDKREKAPVTDESNHIKILYKVFTEDMIDVLEPNLVELEALALDWAEKAPNQMLSEKFIAKLGDGLSALLEQQENLQTQYDEVADVDMRYDVLDRFTELLSQELPKVGSSDILGR